MRKNAKAQKIIGETLQKMPYVLISIKSILYNKYFNIGYFDAKNGLSYNENYDNWDTSDQTFYERGRMYYAATKGKFPPKNGKEVSQWAIQRMSMLLQDKSLI